MKKRLFVIFIKIILVLSIYGNKSYSFPLSDPFTPGLHKFDLRYINILEKENNNKTLEEAYEKIKDVYYENSAIVDFLFTIRSLREKIKTSNYSWSLNNYKNLYKNISEKLYNKESIKDYLPELITIGLLESEGSVNSRDEVIDTLKIIEKDIKVGDLIKINSDSYFFKVRGYKIGESSYNQAILIFIIKKVKKSIYEKLNDNYEISVIVESKNDISNNEFIRLDIKDWSSCYEKDVLYGIVEHNYMFYDNDLLESIVDNLRIRDKSSLNNTNIISKLQKGDVVTYIETGKYEIINQLSGNWIKIKTQDNKIGWCFGAYLRPYYDISF